MILVGLISWQCFGLELTPNFVGGMGLCAIAIYLYYVNPSRAAAESISRGEGGAKGQYELVPANAPAREEESERGVEC
jgi:hypothetical protein